MGARRFRTVCGSSVRRLARWARAARPWLHPRRWYGAGAGHAIAMVCCFSVAGYAAVRLLGERAVAVALWFVGGALLHDLVLLPLYSGADRLAQPRSPGRRSYVGLVRLPAFLAGILLLVWFPLVLGLSGPYPGASGLSEEVYLGRWLAITGGLFAVSALGCAAAWCRRAVLRRRGG